MFTVANTPPSPADPLHRKEQRASAPEMPLAVDTGQNLSAARDEVKRLKQNNEKLKKDLELKQAKRLAAEGISAVETANEVWRAKLAAERREFEVGRRETNERIERYEVRIATNAARIRALEEEVAALKSKLIVAGSVNKKSPVASASESLPALLQRLNLQAYQSRLEEEELDVALLRSMGREVLQLSMLEVGMSNSQVDVLATELFRE